MPSLSTRSSRLFAGKSRCGLMSGKNMMLLWLMNVLQVQVSPKRPAIEQSIRLSAPRRSLPQEPGHKGRHYELRAPLCCIKGCGVHLPLSRFGLHSCKRKGHILQRIRAAGGGFRLACICCGSGYAKEVCPSLPLPGKGRHVLHGHGHHPVQRAGCEAGGGCGEGEAPEAPRAPLQSQTGVTLLTLGVSEVGLEYPNVHVKNF